MLASRSGLHAVPMEDAEVLLSVLQQLYKEVHLAMQDPVNCMAMGNNMQQQHMG